jgi:pyridoxine 4-dehydrogenase
MVDAGTQSCSRLGRAIDVLQLHWCPPLGWQEKQYLDGFGALLESGAASHIGLSNCGPEKLAKLCAYTTRSERPQIVSNQVQFSLLSRQPLNNGLIETAKEEGVQLIGYSPLGLGLLGDKYSIEDGVLPNGVRGVLFREFLPIMTPLLGELREVAKARGKSVAQVVLNWNLSKGFLTLVGMRTYSVPLSSSFLSFLI